MRTVRRLFEQYSRLGKKHPDELVRSIIGIEEPERLLNSIASQLPVDLSEKQKLLQLPGLGERLEYLSVLLAGEREVLELEKRIHMRVRRQMEKSQREYYLREQMKAIQQELGEGDERQAEAEEYRRKIKSAKMPGEVREKALHEVKRLEKMPPMAAEAVVVRNYLDWLVGMPWNKRTTDRRDIEAAQAVLDEDHYGLEKVKERILEYLAVRQLTDGLKGPILCLVGPPGVGKTSLGRSVARALERKFVRISLGGVRDEAEIRGHRRTYIGSMPGRIVQAMRQAGALKSGNFAGRDRQDERRFPRRSGRGAVGSAGPGTKPLVFRPLLGSSHRLVGSSVLDDGQCSVANSAAAAGSDGGHLAPGIHRGGEGGYRRVDTCCLSK